MRKTFSCLVSTIVLIGASLVTTAGAAGAADPGVVVDYGSTDWSYNQVSHGALPGFESPNYSPAEFWLKGQAGFGTTGGTCPWNNLNKVKTRWALNTDLLLRKKFTIPATSGVVRIEGTIDDNADVYLNGALVQHVENGNCIAGGIAVEVSSISSTLLKTENLLAVRASDIGGVETFADLKVTFSPVGPLTPRYVALGDSYASGEGAEESQFATYTTRTGIRTSIPDPDSGGRTTTGCHRSVTSWGYGLFATAKSRGLVDRMEFAACSGAKAADLFNDNATYVKAGAPAEAPQIKSVDHTTTLVSLSIGGNDANFAPILRECTNGRSSGAYDCKKRDAVKKLAMDALDRVGSGGLDIPQSRTDSATYIRQGDKMYLSQVYENVANAMAPTGTLIVAGYPRLFAESKSDYARKDSIQVCKTGTNAGVSKYYVKYEDAKWLNGLVDDVNRAISKQVKAANNYLKQAGSAVKVIYAPSSGDFDDHRLCNSEKWFNGVQFPADPLGRKQQQTSMHPNLSGQKAYCRAVTRALPSMGGRPKVHCSFDKQSQLYR